MNLRTVLVAVCAGVLVVSACAGSDDPAASDPSASELSPTGPTVTEPVPTDPPATDAPVTEPPATDVPVTEPARTDPTVTEPLPSDPVEPDAESSLLADPAALVAALASDELNGRNNQTGESAAARDLLVPLVATVATPHDDTLPSIDGYLQPYAEGTNIIGVMPGRGVLADEYVMIGAHYDHLAPGECDVRGEVDDIICNGAADNAAGVASVLSIADRIDRNDADADDSGRRSVIIALWDGEEDGLVGAAHYVDNPLVPLERTVAYVNFDIQGASLLPAMANSTVLVGPETGGAVLIDIAVRAVDASPLDYALFSLVFGQGRSDHAELVRGGVPSVFFTDANNGCYHTVLDDVDHYEAGKHALQIGTAAALTFDLLTTATPPTFTADAPLSVYDDAVELLALLRRGEADLALLGEFAASASEFITALQTIVDAGPDAYDDAAGGVVLSGAASLVAQLAEAECRLPS